MLLQCQASRALKSNAPIRGNKRPLPIDRGQPTHCGGDYDRNIYILLLRKFQETIIT